MSENEKWYCKICIAVKKIFNKQESNGDENKENKETKETKETKPGKNNQENTSNNETHGNFEIFSEEKDGGVLWGWRLTDDEKATIANNYENYETEEEAKSAIQIIRENGPTAPITSNKNNNGKYKFECEKLGNKQWKWYLMSTENMIIAHGKTYKTKGMTKEALEEIKVKMGQ